MRASRPWDRLAHGVDRLGVGATDRVGGVGDRDAPPHVAASRVDDGVDAVRSARCWPRRPRRSGRCMKISALTGGMRPEALSPKTTCVKSCSSRNVVNSGCVGRASARLSMYVHSTNCPPSREMIETEPYTTPLSGMTNSVLGAARAHAEQPVVLHDALGGVAGGAEDLEAPPSGSSMTSVSVSKTIRSSALSVVLWIRVPTGMVTFSVALAIERELQRHRRRLLTDRGVAEHVGDVEHRLLTDAP